MVVGWNDYNGTMQMINQNLRAFFCASILCEGHKHSGCEVANWFFSEMLKRCSVKGAAVFPPYHNVTSLWDSFWTLRTIKPRTAINCVSLSNVYQNLIKIIKVGKQTGVRNSRREKSVQILPTNNQISACLLLITNIILFNHIISLTSLSFYTSAAILFWNTFPVYLLLLRLNWYFCCSFHAFFLCSFSLAYPSD